MDQKTVEIVIANRKGLGSHVETVDFVDMPTLKQRLDYLVDAVPFHKVIVELGPSWEVTDEEQAILTGLEEGDEKIEADLQALIDARNTVEVTGGVITFDPKDGEIRYTDDHGNTEGLWNPGDSEYSKWKEQYFPNNKIESDDEEDF